MDCFFIEYAGVHCPAKEASVKHGVYEQNLVLVRKLTKIIIVKLWFNIFAAIGLSCLGRPLLLMGATTSLFSAYDIHLESKTK